MDIYVRRSFEILGPFSTQEVQALLDEGKLSLSDDACIAGSKEKWKSLREILPNVPSAVPPNFSLSETAAGSSGEIYDSGDHVGNLQETEVFEPIAKGRISRLASAGKLVGTWLLGVAFFAVIIFTLAAGGRVAAWVQPWIEAICGLSVAVLLPISLLLLFSRRSRGYGGLGIYFASFLVGLSLWVTCFVYAISVSVFWTVVGVLLGGFGIVPMAAIMTLLRRDWSSFGGIIGTVVVLFVLRGFGAWIVEKSEEWNAAAKSRAEAAKGRIVKRANYFIRHWRGQLSLGVSYWVNGFLASFVVAIAAGAVAAMQADVRTQAALALVVFALAIIASVWQGVGIWRSASNHFSRGGTHFWAGTAKVMVILGFLSVSGVIWRNYIPQSEELISILKGDTGIPSYQIQVLPGGTEIEFRGGLRVGSAKELERILAAVPQAKVLHIESPGGRIGEAKQIMQLVRQRSLTTYTSEYCLSAATLVLISGKERVIAADAKVGFHAGSFPGWTAEQQREGDDLVRSTMQSAGVSEQFISRVLATPPEQMWYPSFEEMLRNGVVTSQSYGERFTPNISEADLDALIEKLGVSPLYRTIREFEPEAYTKMMNDFATAIRSGKPEGETIALVFQTADSLMKKYFAAASDKALLALLRNDWIAISRNYKDINSQACIALLLVGDVKVNVARMLPDWDGWKTRAPIYEMVIRSGASKIPAPFDRSAAENDLGKIMDWLGARYGNDQRLLETPTTWMDNSEKVRAMLLTMFEQMTALPEKRAANVVRYFVTAEPNKEPGPEEAATSTQPVVTYRVVKKVDVLNLRAGAGAKYPVVAKLPVGTRGITLGNGRTANGTTMWQEVSVNGYKGWVNEVYIQAEPEIDTPPNVGQSRTAETTEQPQSRAQDFVVTVEDGPDGLILWVQERDSGRLLINTATDGIALNGDLNTGRRAALTVTSQRSGPNMPIASGVFMIERDTLSNGVYEASVHRAHPDEVKRVTSEE